MDLCFLQGTESLWCPDMNILVDAEEYAALKEQAARIDTLENQIKILKAFVISRTSKLETCYEDQIFRILRDRPGNQSLPLNVLWRELRDKNDPSRDFTGKDHASRQRRYRIMVQINSRPDMFKVFKRGGERTIQLLM